MIDLPTKQPEQMTKEQVDAEFSKVEMSFHSYYKFWFTFVGTHDDGRTIEAVYGGNAPDIYRFEVKVGDTMIFDKCEFGWCQVRVHSGRSKVFDWSSD